MKRRGFIAAILAAPLAAWGYFAGNHHLVAGRMAGPDAFAKQTWTTGPFEFGKTGPWVELVSVQVKNTTFMDIKVSHDGKNWKNLKTIAFDGSRGIYSARLKGTLLAGEL